MLCQSRTNHRRITAERKLTEYQDQIHDIGMEFLLKELLQKKILKRLEIDWKAGEEGYWWTNANRNSKTIELRKMGMSCQARGGKWKTAAGSGLDEAGGGRRGPLYLRPAPPP